MMFSSEEAAEVGRDPDCTLSTSSIAARACKGCIERLVLKAGNCESHNLDGVQCSLMYRHGLCKLALAKELFSL